MNKISKPLIIALLMFVTMSMGAVTFASDVPGFTSFDAQKGPTKTKTRITIERANESGYTMYYEISDSSHITPISGATYVGPTVVFVANEEYAILADKYINIYNVADSDDEIVEFHSAQITSAMIQDQFVPNFGNMGISGAVSVNGSLKITFPTKTRKLDDGVLDNTNIKTFIVFKENNESGADVSYTANYYEGVADSYVWINPVADMSYDQEYFIRINTGLEDHSDEAYGEGEFTIKTQAPLLTDGLTFNAVPFSTTESTYQMGTLADANNKFVYTTEIVAGDSKRYYQGQVADGWNDIADGAVFNQVDDLWVIVAEVNGSNQIIQCSHIQPDYNSPADVLNIIFTQGIFEGYVDLTVETIPFGSTLYYIVDEIDEPGPLAYEALVTPTSQVKFGDLTLFESGGMNLPIDDNKFLHIYALIQDEQNPSQYLLQGYGQLQVLANMKGGSVPPITVTSVTPGTAEGKTKVVIDSTGVNGEIKYVVSGSNAMKPSNNHGIPAGAQLMLGDGEITVLANEYIHFYGIDSGTVSGFGERQIVSSEINMANPYNTNVVANFPDQEMIQFTMDVNTLISFAYAIYPGGTDLTNITNQDVLDGTIGGSALAIQKGTDGFDTGDMGLGYVFPLSVQGGALGSYEIAVSTKVGADYYGLPQTFSKSNVESKLIVDHYIGATMKTIPGLFSNGETLASVQMIVKDDNSVKLKLEQTLGSNADATPELIVLRRSLLEGLSHSELIDLLVAEGSNHTHAGNNALKVFSYDPTGEYDVSTLEPGVYSALLKGESGSMVGFDITNSPLVNACIVLKPGTVGLTVEPVFEGKSAYMLVTFDGLVDVLDSGFMSFGMSPLVSADYNGTGSNVPLTLPSMNHVLYKNDVDQQKTTISLLYSENRIDLASGKILNINFDETNLKFLNGEALAVSDGMVVVSQPINNIGTGSFQKSQTVPFTNPTPVKMKYILVKSDLAESFPTEAMNVDAYISDSPSKISWAIAEASASTAISITNLELGTYHLFAVPVDYLDDVYVSPKSANIITIYEQTQSSASSSNNDDDDDTPTPPAPTTIDDLTEASDNTDGDVNQQLDSFQEALEKVETPEEAEKSVGIIGDRIEKAGIDLEELEEKEKEALVNNLSDIMKNTEGIMDKLDDKADKAGLVSEIIASTKKVIEALEKVEDKAGDKKLVNQLNNSLVDLANKVIEQESKIIIKKDTLVMPSDIDAPLKKGTDLKAKLEEKLEEAGIDQELKELKKTVLFKVEGGEKGIREIGFHKDTIEKLAGEVENIQLDFGTTGIQVNSEVMKQAKNNMFFTTEDLGKDANDKKPEGHEKEDIQVRQVEAFEGKERVKTFNKPVKVSFELKDFIAGDVKEEDRSSLVVMVQNEENGEWEPTGGNYDPATGMITFYRIHMSKYTVVKNKKKFSDVENSWAKDEINNLLGKGIADASKEFRPTDTVTREEFAAWICRAYGLKEDGHTEAFLDIDKSNPYYKEIANASKQGLVLGRSETEFAPKEAITREEMATLVARAISNYNDVKVPNDGEKRFASLVDDENTSDWAVDSVAMMIDMGIMETGDDGNFNPQEPISKEAAADIFAKLYK